MRKLLLLSSLALAIPGIAACGEDDPIDGPAGGGGGTSDASSSSSIDAGASAPDAMVGPTADATPVGPDAQPTAQ